MTDAESTPITGIGELTTNDGDDGTYAVLNGAALVISGNRVAWTGPASPVPFHTAIMRDLPHHHKRSRAIDAIARGLGRTRWQAIGLGSLAWQKPRSVLRVTGKTKAARNLEFKQAWPNLHSLSCVGAARLTSPRKRITSDFPATRKN